MQTSQANKFNLLTLNTKGVEVKPHGAEQRAVIKQTSEKLASNELDLVATEVPIAFAYNGQSHAVMMASPMNLHDYAIGFSLTERVVDSIDDILDVEISQAKQPQYQRLRR